MPGYPTCNGNSYAEGLHVRLNGQSSVGALCQDLPAYAQSPPIETVTFGWGVNEDGQLVSELSGFAQLPRVCQADEAHITPEAARAQALMCLNTSGAGH